MIDWLWLAKAFVMGVVQGVTEFLPISSTGHLILAGSLLDFGDSPQVHAFLIVIQGASILAVCWEYRRRLVHTVFGLRDDPTARRFALNVAIAFMPLAIIGLLFKSVIESHLFNPIIVAVALIVGGLVIFWAEKRRHRVRVLSVDDMTPLDAIKLGFCQALALIPGTSRSGATIIGGLFLGLSRSVATEFSFFLAIPTLLLATAYQLASNWAILSIDDVGFFVVGSVASFVSAFIAVRGLLRYIRTHDFMVFGVYRVVFGAIVLLTMSWAQWG